MGFTQAMRVRVFTPDDYPAIAAIEKQNFPDYGHDANDMRRRDETRPAHIRWGRLVAEEDGAIIGHASYGQPVDMFHPHKFRVEVSVAPAFQERGVGTMLYDALMEALAPFEPVTLRTQAQESRTPGLRFLEKRGFVEEMRDFESRLDVARFNAMPFAEAEKRVTDAGIVIKSVAELVDDPDRDHKLYELDWAVTLDMPSPDVLTKPAYEVFRTNAFDNPNYLPSGWFVALDGDKYVGESQLWKGQGEADLYTGATGVLREYRRKGIALALKLRAVAYAQSVSCPRVKTWNCTTNRAMLSINEALGYEKEPAWITYVKHLIPETAGDR